MAQFARPASDITVGSWTTSPLYASIDEASYDDGDYITSVKSATAETFEVKLSSVTDPQSGANHTIRIRASASLELGSTADVYLYQGATLIATRATINLTTSFAEYTYTLSEKDADAITDYTDLRIRVTASVAKNKYAYVSWAELEVPTAPVLRSADSGFRYAGTIAERTDGGYSTAWTNPNNMTGASDTTYATVATASAYIDIGKILIEGSPDGDPVWGGQTLASDNPADRTSGGSTSLFSLTLAYTDINHTGFGVQFAFSGAKIVSATNYGFSIPSGATIDGIELVLRGYVVSTRFGSTAYVDNVGIKVYYTEGGGGVTTAPNYYYAQQ